MQQSMTYWACYICDIITANNNENEVDKEFRIQKIYKVNVNLLR